MSLEKHIQVPIFINDGLATQSCVYSLHAYVVHHGLSPKSGHYTTVLMRGSKKFWLCDDARSAELHSVPPPNHYKDCYILWYYRSANIASNHHV